MYGFTTNNYATSHTLILFLDIRNTGHIEFLSVNWEYTWVINKIVFIQVYTIYPCTNHLENKTLHIANLYLKEQY